MSTEEILYHSNDIIINDIPCCLEKLSSVSIRTPSLLAFNPNTTSLISAISRISWITLFCSSEISFGIWSSSSKSVALVSAVKCYWKKLIASSALSSSLSSYTPFWFWILFNCSFFLFPCTWSWKSFAFLLPSLNHCIPEFCFQNYSSTTYNSISSAWNFYNLSLLVLVGFSSNSCSCILTTSSKVSICLNMSL